MLLFSDCLEFTWNYSLLLFVYLVFTVGLVCVLICCFSVDLVVYFACFGLGCLIYFVRLEACVFVILFSWWFGWIAVTGGVCCVYLLFISCVLRFAVEACLLGCWFAWFAVVGLGFVVWFAGFTDWFVADLLFGVCVDVDLFANWLVCLVGLIVWLPAGYCFDFWVVYVLILCLLFYLPSVWTWRLVVIVVVLIL